MILDFWLIGSVWSLLSNLVLIGGIYILHKYTSELHVIGCTYAAYCVHAAASVFVGKCKEYIQCLVLAVTLFSSDFIK